MPHHKCAKYHKVHFALNIKMVEKNGFFSKLMTECIVALISLLENFILLFLRIPNKVFLVEKP